MAVFHSRGSISRTTRETVFAISVAARNSKLLAQILIPVSSIAYDFVPPRSKSV